MRPLSKSEGHRKGQGAVGRVIGDVAITTLGQSNAIVPVAGSHAFGKAHIYTALVHETPHNTRFGVTSVFWVTIPLNRHVAHRRLNGEDEERIQVPYSINIVSPGSNKIIQLDQEADNLHFFINPVFMNEVASELAGVILRDISLRPVFGTYDQNLAYLLRVIERCMWDEDDLSQLKMDYLSRALCVDLLIKYSLEPITVSGFKSSLEGLSQHHILLLQDYLETYLSQTIRVGDLASLCGISIAGFSSRFKVSTGMTPYQYLLNMRIKKAKHLLSTSSMPIAEVAVQCGFVDQAHLTSTFRRYTGIQPSVYRKGS